MQPQRTVERGPDLVVLTVCIERHYDDIRRNLALIDRLNPEFDWHWVIVDNSSTGPSRLRVDHPRVEIRSGVPLDRALPENARFSYHHALALNANLSRPTARHLLVLDPDLYVIYPDWMRAVTEHMRMRNLSFFGIPWHPRWYTKYRRFPSVHFMLMDCDRVPCARLDFRPELVERPSWSKRRQQALTGALAEPGAAGARSRPTLRTLGWSALNAVYRAGYPLLSRQLIGSSRDTGWKIWAEFARSRRHRAEVALPVVDIGGDFPRPEFLAKQSGRLLERMMPAGLRFLPAPGSYVTPADAQGFDSADFEKLSAEKFMWRGRPFAFHMRRHLSSQQAGGETEAALLERVLQ